MRKSREAKVATRNQIMIHAAQLFREKGVEQTSVSDVMQSTKLTHGGFYRHFQSKDELVSAAFKSAVDDVMEGFQTDLAQSPRDEVLRAYIESYLSDGHVKHPGIGCPVAALAVDIGRIGAKVSGCAADSIADLIEVIGGLFPVAPEYGQRNASVLLATLVGAVVIARATGGAKIGTSILEACLQTYSEAGKGAI